MDNYITWATPIPSTNRIYERDQARTCGILGEPGRMADPVVKYDDCTLHIKRRTIAPDLTDLIRKLKSGVYCIQGEDELPEEVAPVNQFQEYIIQ